MPTSMALWRLGNDGSASPIQEEQLAAEKLIESAVESAPELLGVDVLIIGRQVATPTGPLDLLAIDADANLVVIENKRDRTPREVLAQTIDYTAYVSKLTFDEVETIYQGYRQRFADANPDLAEAYEEHFEEPLESLADNPRMIVVASRLDDSTERMIDFLAVRFGVPVNAALFQPFAGGLIGRTWLRPDEPGRPARRSASRAARKEQAQQFWDAWLPIGHRVLPEIRLPTNGPRSVFMHRRIMSGIPAALTVWVSSAEAYAEVALDDDDPSMNEAWLNELKEKRSSVEQAFGEPLEWREPEAGGLLTKRTKIVTPKVPIGEMSNPTTEGLESLAEIARRLLDAVKPYLPDTYETALARVDTASAVTSLRPDTALEH
jgi:hypothetical protein